VNVKGHAGYCACDKCSPEGEYVAGRMTFPKNKCRTVELEGYDDTRDQ